MDQSVKLSSNLRPVIIADTEDSVQLQELEKAKKEGVRAIVLIPIYVAW